MTREECPKEYFEHLVEVVRSVFAAEHKLKTEGKLTLADIRAHNADWYCEQVAEELISKTAPEELES